MHSLNVVRAARRQAVQHRNMSAIARRSLVPNMGIVFVPQQSAYVVERLGRFNAILSPGIHILLPVLDKVAYIHSLKEEAVNIPSQSAITRDNVTIRIDGVLYLRVVDAEKASYGVEDAVRAVTLLAQTTMRSELGKITLDKTFEERENLNLNIVAAINRAAADWGVECLRYEIRDIQPPEAVRAAMDKQAEAERNKRANILESEGAMQSEINEASGAKNATVLNAEGEASAILAKAKATAEGIRVLSEAIATPYGKEAVSLRVAEQYVDSFGKIAKESTTVLLPSDTGNVASMVSQALAVYGKINPQFSPLPSSTPAPPSSPVSGAGGDGGNTQHDIAKHILDEEILGGDQPSNDTLLFQNEEPMFAAINNANRTPDRDTHQEPHDSIDEQYFGKKYIQ